MLLAFAPNLADSTPLKPIKAARGKFTASWDAKASVAPNDDSEVAATVVPVTADADNALKFVKTGMLISAPARPVVLANTPMAEPRPTDRDGLSRGVAFEAYFCWLRAHINRVVP
jgi:hypothetical protein